VELLSARYVEKKRTRSPKNSVCASNASETILKWHIHILYPPTPPFVNPLIYLPHLQELGRASVAAYVPINALWVRVRKDTVV